MTICAKAFSGFNLTYRSALKSPATKSSVYFGMQRDEWRRQPEALLGSPPAAVIEAARHYQKIGKKLDAGSYGSTYLLEVPTAQKIVLKAPHQAKDCLNDHRVPVLNFDFTQEARILARLPQQSQRQGIKFIGLIQAGGQKLLAMSFVDGKPLDPIQNPLNARQLQSLNTYLSQLDREGIYHSDLHESNILFTPAQANVIDYGEASLFNPLKPKAVFIPSENRFAPPFGLLDNATNFQTKGLPLYFHKLLASKQPTASQQVKSLFKDFLVGKSKGQRQYLDFLRSQIRQSGEPVSDNLAEAVDYTALQAKFLCNPPDALLIQQAWKTEALFCYAMAGRENSFFNHPYKARQWGHWAEKATRQYQANTEELLQAVTTESTDLQRFLQFEKRLGEFIHQSGQAYLDTLPLPSLADGLKASASIRPSLFLAQAIENKQAML